METAKRKGGMRFREFGNFNLAMLAKHLWMIITRPHSLVARVLKKNILDLGMLWRQALKVIHLICGETF